MAMRRQNDGRDANPTLADLNPPAPGAGVWQQNPGTPLPPVLGLRLPRITPLATRDSIAVSSGRPESAHQPGVRRRLQPGEGARQVRQHASGRLTRQPRRSSGPTTTFASGTRACSDLLTAHGLDLVQTARMLAMAHVSGGDAMISCFDAKYFYWFWRPYQAIPHADTDGNPATTADPDLAAATLDAEFPGVPVSARVSQRRRGGSAESFFGTDKISVPSIAESPAPSANYRQVSRCRERCERSARAGWIPLPQLRSGGGTPRARRRALCRDPFVSAD